MPGPTGSPVPAGFWHRGAAWSIDAALIAPVALLLAWPWIAGSIRAWPVPAEALLRHAGERMGAAIIDGVPLPLLATSLLRDPAIKGAIAALESNSWSLLWPLVLAFALIGAGYHVGCECSPRQATFGKRLLGMRVHAHDGRRLSAGRALARHGASALSWATLNLGHLMATAAPQHLALHDRCSGTRVVSDTATGLPGWAYAWLALLALAGVGLSAWIATAAAAIMRAALEQALF